MTPEELDALRVTNILVYGGHSGMYKCVYKCALCASDTIDTELWCVYCHTPLCWDHLLGVTKNYCRHCLYEAPVDEWSPKAWMSVPDADFVHRCVRALPPSAAVLEWGSGKSTVFFTESRPDLLWQAREHDLEWALRVRSDLLSTRAEVLQLPLNDDYVRVPLSHIDSLHSGQLPDLILVDGRLRRRCLLEAAKLTRGTQRHTPPLVILHDAQRPYYRCALQAFRYGEHVSEMLWVGCQDLDTFVRAVGRPPKARPYQRGKRGKSL